MEPVKDELLHYGVKGMKWGIRRYQNSDGTLTAAGKKKARQEYRQDNKTAYELGKQATVYGHAAAKSIRRTAKIEKKLDKQFSKEEERPSYRTKNLARKWNASAMTTARLTQLYVDSRSKAEAHCKSLIDKYGQEAVSSIKYKDVKLPKGEFTPSTFRTMNERTNTMSDYAAAGAASLASVALSATLRLPVTVIYGPKTTGEKARDLESTMYYSTLHSQKRVNK